MSEFKIQLNNLLCNSLKNDSEVIQNSKMRVFQYMFKKRCQHVIWELLHSFSVFYYPDIPNEQQKENTKELLLKIKYCIPFCMTCGNGNNSQDNFLENYNLDLAVSSSQELIHFLIEYHKFINTTLSKVKNYDASIYTIEFVKKKYQNELYCKFLEDNYNISFFKIISEDINENILKQKLSVLQNIIVKEIKNINFDLFLNIEIHT